MNHLEVAVQRLEAAARVESVLRDEIETAADKFTTGKLSRAEFAARYESWLGAEGARRAAELTLVHAHGASL